MLAANVQIFGDVDLTPTDLLACFLLAQAAQRCKRQAAALTLLRGDMVEISMPDEQDPGPHSNDQNDRSADAGMLLSHYISISYVVKLEDL